MGTHTTTEPVPVFSGINVVFLSMLTRRGDLLLQSHLVFMRGATLGVAWV